MVTTLVTGGTGFVGRYVVDRLVSGGDRVISYNRDFTDGGRDVIAVQGELFELPRLLEVLQEYSVDRIIHTAAQSHPEVSIKLPVTTFASNVDGTLKVFEAARIAGVTRVVNFSSECAYGNQAGCVHENAVLAPTTPYGVTKVATELLGQVYSDLYGLDILSLRISEVYGPGNRMPEILKEMICSGLGRDPVRLPHGSEHPFQFVHVQDVASAGLAAADAPADCPHRVFNVTAGSQVRLDEASVLVRDAVPEADITLGPGFIPGWDVQGAFDLALAREVLGYEPQWSLVDGIRTYADWLSQHAH